MIVQSRSPIVIFNESLKYNREIIFFLFQCTKSHVFLTRTTFPNIIWIIQLSFSPQKRSERAGARRDVEELFLHFPNWVDLFPTSHHDKTARGRVRRVSAQE